MSPSGIPTGEVWLPDIDPPGEWATQGACRWYDPETWFPTRGANTAFAKAVCADCPVRSECLDYALKWRIYYGIWGGLTVESRKQLMKTTPRERRPAPAHGTPGRYRYGCHCDGCKEAHRLEIAGYRRAAHERAGRRP